MFKKGLCKDNPVTVVKSLAAALRQKRQPLVLDLESSEDLQCRNLLCEKVGEACICRLSHVLESLEDVRHLNIAANRLTALPASIWKMLSLESLDLSQNDLTELPKDASQLTNLKRLDVRGNLKLKMLPTELSCSPKLMIALPDHLQEGQ